jgi:hypothetical protein
LEADLIVEESDMFDPVALAPESGDPDLYVWGPNGDVWYSNSSTGIESITFEGSETGTYQIEVHGYMAGMIKTHGCTLREAGLLSR